MTGRQAVLVLGILAGALPLLAPLPGRGMAAGAGEVAGFGIVVSAAGDVLAPFHVVMSCDSLESPSLGRLHVMHADSVLDLAHLMAETEPASFAHFADSSTVKPGDELTLLEPAPGAPPGAAPGTRTATVAALFDGIRAASFLTLFDAEGGAPGDALLLDGAGGLVGFIVRDLDDRAMAGMDMRLWLKTPPGSAVSRDAVGEAMLRHFLEHHKVPYRRQPAATGTAAERARAAVTPIRCGP